MDVVKKRLVHIRPNKIQAMETNQVNLLPRQNSYIIYPYRIVNYNRILTY